MADSRKGANAKKAYEKKKPAGKQRGKRYTEDVKMAALELLAAGFSVADAAAKMGIPSSTIGSWAKNTNYVDPEFIQKLRAKKQAQFVAKAWNNITQSQVLLDTQLATMTERMGELLELLDEIEEYRNEHSSEKPSERALPETTVEHAIRVLKDWTGPSLGELSRVIGTMYDKQALAAGDATVNVGGSVGVSYRKFEDL